MVTKFYPISLLLLRLFGAFMFWQHGAQKLFGFFGGEPAAPFTLLWFAGAAEFLGAIAIAIGFLTRPFAAILAVDMAILYLTRYVTLGAPIRNVDGEVACILALIAALLVVTGPERLSVDSILRTRQTGTSVPDDPRLQDHFPVVLGIFRILIGLLFLQHGMQKVLGMLGGEPYEFPNMRWFAGVIELFSGPAIALGLLTRPVAFLVCGEMASAYFINHFYRGFWPIQNLGERAVLFCFIFLFLLTTGPGKFALDSVLWKKNSRAEEPVILRN